MTAPASNVVQLNARRRASKKSEPTQPPQVCAHQQQITIRITEIIRSVLNTVIVARGKKAGLTFLASVLTTCSCLIEKVYGREALDDAMSVASDISSQEN